MKIRYWSIILGGVLALALGGCGSGASEKPAPAAEEEMPVMGPERYILAFGDSLFAGYGLSSAEAYPVKLEAALRAKGVNAKISNAGVSGDTTAAGLQRLKFTLDAQKQKPDLFILELGGNDLLRGLSVAETRANLSAILTELKAREIPVLMMGMRAPVNMGDSRAEFDAIYPALAKEYGAELYPFFLEEIYRDPSLFQADHIHPTSAGLDRIVAATSDVVTKALPPVN